MKKNLNKTPRGKVIVHKNPEKLDRDLPDGRRLCLACNEPKSMAEYPIGSYGRSRTCKTCTSIALKANRQKKSDEKKKREALGFFEF